MAAVELSEGEAGLLALLVSEAGDRQQDAGNADAAKVRYDLAVRLFRNAGQATYVATGDSMAVVLDSRGRLCRITLTDQAAYRLDDGQILWPSWVADEPEGDLLDVQVLVPITE